MSHSDFRAYYEANHVHLAAQLMPPADCYRRNYIIADDPFTAEISSHTHGNHEQPFDAITEIIYPTRESAELMLKVLSTTDKGRIIMEDEAKFCDRDQMKMFVVQVCQSATPWSM